MVVHSKGNIIVYYIMKNIRKHTRDVHVFSDRIMLIKKIISVPDLCRTFDINSILLKHVLVHSLPTLM